MPRYDFECPHGHRFEYDCSMADRDKPIPCEGVVNQLAPDELVEQYPEGAKLPDGLARVPLNDGMGNKILVKEVPCALSAVGIITHSNPAGALDHGSASNRDAAREGRYDPLNPNRRFMAKGRSWRK